MPFEPQSATLFHVDPDQALHAYLVQVEVKVPSPTRYSKHFYERSSMNLFGLLFGTDFRVHLFSRHTMMDFGIIFTADNDTFQFLIIFNKAESTTGQQTCIKALNP